MLLSCASTERPDPIQMMSDAAEKHINDRIVRAKTKSLLDRYRETIEFYYYDAQQINEHFGSLLQNYENHDIDFDQLLEDTSQIRKDLYEEVLDLEEELREVLSHREWKKIKNRSLIVLTDYYLIQEEVE